MRPSNPLTPLGWGLFLGLLAWLGWLVGSGASWGWRVSVGVLTLGVALEAWWACRH